ncbi:MAG: hypothetical protein ABMA25_02490 [Ilumatobacteraceae bacterium]
MTRPRTMLILSILAVAATSVTTWWLFGRADEPPATSGPAAAATLPTDGSTPASTDMPVTSTTATAATAGLAYPTGLGVEFPIDGSPLPEAISGVYRESGGELLREPPAADYGIGGWPQIVGVGVYTTDVEVTVTLVGDTVMREDSTVWLFSDPRSVKKLITDFAVALRLPGATTSETRQGSMGPCTLSTFTAADGTEWQIGGCDFDQVPGVRSLAVARKAVYDASAASTTSLTSPPDVAAVVAGLPATVTGWSTTFGQPDDVHGELVAHTVSLSYGTMSVLDAADKLEGLLPESMSRVDSIDEVTTLSTPTSTWNIAPEGIVFTVWGDGQ